MKKYWASSNEYSNKSLKLRSRGSKAKNQEGLSQQILPTELPIQKVSRFKLLGWEAEGGNIRRNGKEHVNVCKFDTMLLVILSAEHAPGANIQKYECWFSGLLAWNGQAAKNYLY